MPQATLPCQLDNPATGDSSGFSLPGQRSHSTNAALRVVPNAQWIGTTTGRIATCAHSWMQSVHWVVGSGLYVPSRTHGPRGMNQTTIRICQEISALSECRPGIGYLARKLGLSERAVQYHLDMLREAGLLAYRSKGTRISGTIRQASVYERLIPTEFDTALGIQTVGEGVQRRPVGIAEESRSTIGKLAKKAARKVRRSRSRKPPQSKGRCTPMQGGTSNSSSAGTTTSPTESKLDDGTSDFPTQKSPKKPRRTLNRVGRRHQLARELVAQVPWLGNAAPARIAWVAREVSDAGWSAVEVAAYLDQFGIGDHQGIRRPSGVLSRRLRGATRLLRTPQARQECVQAWRDSQQAARGEHNASQYKLIGDPSSAHVQNLFDEALRRSNPQASTVTDVITPEAKSGLEVLSRADVVRLRSAALANPDEIGDAIEVFGEDQARRLYTNAAVNQYQALQEACRV